VNILIVSQYFWPENFRVNDLCEEWVSRGHMVTVLTGKPNYPSGQVFPEYRQCPDAFNNFGGAKVCRVPMLARGKGAFRLFLNYLSFVLGACLFGPLFLRGRKFDVVFVFEPSPVTVGLPAILLGRVKRAPVVFWALDLWPETLAAIGVVRSPRVLGLVGHLVRFIYKHCTLVLGQSKGFLVNIAKYCSSPEKIRYFPSWAEDVFEKKNAIPANEIDRLPGGFNVLFAGNVGESQDLPAVLVAAEALRAETNVRWFILGDGRKFDWLSAEVARRGLQDQVFLLGRFPVERMPSFYACADALLVSLKRDPVFSMTIPGKVQSYLMAGVPLLGMLDGEGAKVISDAKAGLVCPAGNGLGLAAAVRRMLALSPEARYQLGVNGRAFAELEFGRGLLMDRLVCLLHEAVDLYRNKRVVP
jgi:colanic acid biosynthesis glycosyl transferase WcaI